MYDSWLRRPVTSRHDRVEQPTPLDDRPWLDATCVTPSGGHCTADDAAPDAALDTAQPDATAMDAAPEAQPDASTIDAQLDAGADSGADSADAAEGGDASCNPDAMDCVGFVRQLFLVSTSTLSCPRAKAGSSGSTSRPQET